jgi:hypothetical protein
MLEPFVVTPSSSFGTADTIPPFSSYGGILRRGRFDRAFFYPVAPHHGAIRLGALTRYLKE